MCRDEGRGNIPGGNAGQEERHRLGPDDLLDPKVDGRLQADTDYQTVQDD